MIDWLAWTPWIMAAILGAVIAFIVFNWFRTKKMPPTDEPVVGEYRIEVDVGTHIVAFEGTLYYFRNILNPNHLHVYAQTLSENLQNKLDNLRTFLQKNAYFYAMRQGTKKIAFVSLNHPVEVSPFFKSEEGSAKKIVHATGKIGESTKGFQHVTMEPINLRNYELNPKEYAKFDDVGKLLTTLFEKAPLIQQIESERAKNKIMQDKVNDMANEIGRLKDEAVRWKYEAKGKGVEKTEEEGLLAFPLWLKKYLPYGLALVIGYLISPQIPQLTETHPIILGIAFVAGLFIVRKGVRR